MMSAHDAIRPTLENAYDEDWDGAKQDIAMQIWQRYMNTPEMAIGENAQLREQFAQQRKEVRDIARQQALEARAKAQIAAAQQARKHRTTCGSPTGELRPKRTTGRKWRSSLRKSRRPVWRPGCSWKRISG